MPDQIEATRRGGGAVATQSPDPADGRPRHLSFRGVAKSYPAARRRTADTVVLDGIDLDLAHGQFVSVLGPSGCGKSTLLTMAAGLSRPTAGSVELDGREVTAPGPDRGMVFQQHVLLPWMTALGNVKFALRSARPELTDAERDDIARHHLSMVHLDHAIDRKPGELSGGMRQRVGIARAFAIHPSVLLLDEPFGALDALTRLSLQRQLLEVWENDRRTVLMVTHDVDEALLLSDRIIVLGGGSPARIIHDVEVPFARPRRAEDVELDPDYLALKRTLIRSLT
ncbi:ABC transporter ATP-binding protein [Corynebacterium hansenii]|uniref:ABC transporter ATP-binding protein n=1 Tax=Corynebacterium hansenii TaxID=394964 RepID=A0ABV7ZN71_9CORY|nr:ABC transporter ATP-binding protein [Corynebacterium hansenii]WJY98961.1 Bicarbonate transport ATP-binding protein CmpD [Corynebacterium hansenii]